MMEARVGIESTRKGFADLVFAVLKRCVFSVGASGERHFVRFLSACRSAAKRSEVSYRRG
jgi:hypothetical protein